MALHVASARQVQTAPLGTHADSGRLFLTVRDTGASWVLRFTVPDGRHREMGLGPAGRSTLVAAGETVTLARVARAYHEEIVEPQRTSRHAAQWISSLEQNVPATIWHAPIDTVEPVALLEVLAPLRKRVPETCDRVRQRLEVIFSTTPCP